MGRTPRHLVLGLLVLAAVLWGSQSASSQPSAPDVVRGTVAAGHPAVGPGWHVSHLAPGFYRVVVTGDHGTLDVTEWDAAADVTITPGGGGSSLIEFRTAGRPVDTDFEFVALLD